MENTKVTSVSDTAITMAAVRACESRRAAPLFIDPFAAKLAGTEAVAKAQSKVDDSDNQGRPFGQVRTKFLDDFLLARAADCSQVVLLGAGLDTRAYRLNLPPNLVLFELDRPEIIDYKRQILAEDMPTCDRRAIATDLANNTWLDLIIEAGFQPGPTHHLATGRVYLLPKRNPSLRSAR